MAELIRETKPKAKKDHDCDACVWLTNDYIDIWNFTKPERRAVIKARANNWKIKKGDIYSLCSMKEDGEIYTFKSIPEINDICIKYELYGDC